MTPIVEVEGLTYRYPTGQANALEGVSFAVEAGQLVGVVGPNSAGKSTLCYALLGLVPQVFRGQYEGRVTVAGMDASRTPVYELARRAGLVFQNPFTQLSGARLTVEEEIAFGLENFGVPRDEMRRRVEWAMDQVGIAHLREKSPFLLSGGELQRLAIACMLAQRPDVLVLDEPTSQLDPRGTSEVFDCIARLRADGLTVVMVEHKLERLLEHADRLLLLADGRVRAWGPPGEVLESGQLEACGLALPAHIRVAACLGARSASGSLPLTIEDTVAALRAARLAAKADPFEPAARTMEAPADREESRPPTSRTVPRITLRGVSFAYPDGTRIFEELNLALGDVEPGMAPGEYVAAGFGPIALIGENGAGKTTLVKLIAGLLRPESGEILIDGQAIRGQTAAQIARTVGLVFQNPDDQLFKSRALEEAMFGALNLGLSPRQAERRAREALQRVGLGSLADENPYDLSLGQRKMLALASVLAMQTPILILDEPTIAQDHPGVERIGRLVRELQTEGRLVVVITHDMEFVARYCPRVVVLARGAVLAAGSARAVFAQRELLQQAGLEPPSTLRLARALGLSTIPLTPGEFIEYWTGLWAGPSRRPGGPDLPG